MLENIDVASLPCLPLTDCDQLPTSAAIYFALSNVGTVLYVGKTVNLNQRWMAHHRKKQLCSYEGVKIAWLEIEDKQQLSSVEVEAITYFQPSLNGREIPASLRPTDAFMKVITQQIREVMQTKAVSQGELSRRTGIERPNITRMLSGRSGKVPESWEKIFNELDLELVAVPKGTDVSKFFRKGK